MIQKKIVKKSVQQKVKESNMSAIFSLIAKSDGISRVDIAKRIGLSTSTVSTLTDELLHRRIILETGEVKSGDVGRRAISLQINPLGGFFVCVIFQKGEFRIDIYNLKAKLESSHTVNCNGKVLSSAFMIEKISDNIEFGYKYGEFFGLLFILPSWASGARGTDLFSERFGYSFESNCFNTIKNYYKRTLVLSESAITLSIHEQSFNNSIKGSGVNVLYVNLSDTATSYLMINGEILDGKKESRDFGKMSVDFNVSGEKKLGQLKDFITTDAIVSAVEIACGKHLTFDNIVEEYQKDNELVVAVVDNACRALAFAITNVASVIDLKAVVISGDITSLGAKFKGNIYSCLFTFDKSLKNLFVKFFENNYLVSQCGAYYLFEKVFNVDHLETLTNNY